MLYFKSLARSSWFTAPSSHYLIKWFKSLVLWLDWHRTLPLSKLSAPKLWLSLPVLPFPAKGKLNFGLASAPCRWDSSWCGSESVQWGHMFPSMRSIQTTYPSRWFWPSRRDDKANWSKLSTLLSVSHSYIIYKKGCWGDQTLDLLITNATTNMLNSHTLLYFFLLKLQFIWKIF